MWDLIGNFILCQRWPISPCVCSIFVLALENVFLHWSSCYDIHLVVNELVKKVLISFFFWSGLWLLLKLIFRDANGYALQTNNYSFFFCRCRLVVNKCSTNSEFAEFCHRTESVGKPSLDSLLNMPVSNLLLGTLLLPLYLRKIADVPVHQIFVRISMILKSKKLTKIASEYGVEVFDIS